MNKLYLLLSIFSGLCMALSWPYIGNITPLFFVSLIPLLYLEHLIVNNSPYKKNVRLVFAYSFITFLLFNFITTYWIAYASFGGMLSAEFANAAVFAIVFTLFHYTKYRLGSKKGYIAFIFYWIGFEWIHHNWEISYPWLTFGNVFSTTPSIVQWYEYTGVLGGSLWVLLSNILGFHIWLIIIGKKATIKQRNILITALVLLIATPIMLSILVASADNKKQSSITVGIIQPNVNPYKEKFNTSFIDIQVNRLVKQILQVSKTANLVIAPETTIPGTLLEGELNKYPQLKEICNTVKKTQVPVLIGASTYKTYPLSEKPPSKTARKTKEGWIDFYNTALFITPNDIGIYHKSKLVLGVEKIPFQNLFSFFSSLAIDLGGVAGSLGVDDIQKCFYFGETHLAPVVCYESIYGQFVGDFIHQGANLLAIITNDAWWDDTPGYKQHLSYARLRAIETRRSIVRSANTGISAVISPLGKIIKKTSWNETTTLQSKVYLNNKKTFYTQYGDYIGRSLAGFSLFILLLAVVRKEKSRA